MVKQCSICKIYDDTARHRPGFDKYTFWCHKCRLKPVDQPHSISPPISLPRRPLANTTNTIHRYHPPLSKQNETTRKRCAAQFLHDDGMTYKQLRTHYGFSYSFLNRWCTRDHFDDEPRSGRPREVDDELICSALLVTKSQRLSSLITNTPRSTVEYVAHRHHLTRRVRRSAPILTPEHKKKRLDFAIKNLNRDWSRVAVSDEKLFKCEIDEKYEYCFEGEKPGRRLKSSHPPKVMVT
jgi:hypothetical protein